MVHQGSNIDLTCFFFVCLFFSFVVYIFFRFVVIAVVVVVVVLNNMFLLWLVYLYSHSWPGAAPLVTLIQQFFHCACIVYRDINHFKS